MCLCPVDDYGECSFISSHGAEYRFRPELFQHIDFEDVDWIYADGLEIEAQDGDKIIDFLEGKGKKLFFTPGPRLNMLGEEKLRRLLSLHPVLHINEREAGLVTGKTGLWESAENICAMTGNTVIITLGENCTLLKKPRNPSQLIPTKKMQTTDSTGAGDNHAGTVPALISRCFAFEAAVRAANIVSGYLVQQKGAGLGEENFHRGYSQKEIGLLPL